MDNKILTFEEIMDYHPANIVVYEEIKDNLEDLVPFIGAGLSAFIYPLWKDALKRLVKNITDLDDYTYINKCIEDPEKLEEAAELIENKRGAFNLSRDLVNLFSIKKLRNYEKNIKNEAIGILPLLFSKSVITTNFDTIIEHTYQQYDKSFNHVLLPIQPELIRQNLLQNKKHVLYKVHGEITDNIDYSSIIFTKKQYDSNYDFENAMVKGLRDCFKSGMMFFLGCSLQQDRTINELKKVVEFGVSHFGIVDCKIEERDKRIKFLSDYNIRTILYPNNHHEAVRIILEQLLKDTNRTTYEDLIYKLSQKSLPNKLPQSVDNKNQSSIDFQKDLERGYESVKQIEKIILKYPDSEEIVVQLVWSLANLTTKQNLEDIEESIRKIKELRNKYPDNQVIAEKLSFAYASLSAKQDLEGIEDTVLKIEELKREYPESEKVSVWLAWALANLTTKQDLEGIEESIRKIKELRNKYPDNQVIAEKLSFAYVSLSAKQDLEGIEESIRKIKELRNKYPDNQVIAEKLSFAYASLSAKQDLEGIEDTVLKIEELKREYPESEEVSVWLAWALANLTTKQNLEGIEKTIKELKELKNEYPDNSKIAGRLTFAFANLASK